MVRYFSVYLWILEMESDENSRQILQAKLNKTTKFSNKPKKVSQKNEVSYYYKGK